ncbi:MAG TPA: hypothetical protein VM261_22775 [Kofleriaceae bacterium]|nr:hypothetical protein [Kofleriaceae bacterium]
MKGSALACLLAPALAFAPSTAAAERDTIITFSGGMSAIGPLDPPIGVGGPEAVGLQVRGIVSFEPPPLPYKEPRGYNFAGVLVPEIFAGAIMADDDRTELIGAGLRLEAAFSQRRMGLLQVSARGGVYLAGRGGFFTDPGRTPFVEGAFGEYFLIGDTARLGIELGIMQIMLEEYEWVVDRPLPAGAIAGPPFENGLGEYLNINAALYLGVVM